jgi:hypothetical protein
MPITEPSPQFHGMQPLGGAKWRSVYDTDDGMTTQKAEGEILD